MSSVRQAHKMFVLSVLIAQLLLSMENALVRIPLS